MKEPDSKVFVSAPKTSVVLGWSGTTQDTIEQLKAEHAALVAVAEAAQFAVEKIRIYQERGSRRDRDDLNLAEAGLRRTLAAVRNGKAVAS